MSLAQPEVTARPQLPKTPTGITGLDEITGGGLPKGRSTLVCGSTGCGKTLLAMEFLVRGIEAYQEPGVYMAFEEAALELTENVASLGFDLNKLISEKKMLMDVVYFDRHEMLSSGTYNLDGLFIRLGQAIEAIGAKRVVLDSIDALFITMPAPSILRAELSYLLRWLKAKGITAVITGEAGINTLTRQGLEEYVSDCVIVLDHRVNNQICSRRLRVVKYRGSTHGTNEYPFLINEDGISVLPVTSLNLQHEATNERISSGIKVIDNMLGGEGFFRASSILVSGTGGTGKSSIAAHFIDATCRRGERALYFSFEESPMQILRNMRSIGINLEQWVNKGLLHFQATRPAFAGLEMQLTLMHNATIKFDPKVVIIDPLNCFIAGGNANEVKSMLTRLEAFLKNKKISSMFTQLISINAAREAEEISISSMIDTWIRLQDFETGGDRQHQLSIIKSRGMSHSSRTQKFLLTGHGVELTDIGELASSLPPALAQQAAEERLTGNLTLERRKIEQAAGRRALKTQIDALRAGYVASIKILTQDQD